MTQYQIEITDHQQSFSIDHGFLKLAICRVLSEEGVDAAKISVVLVNDSKIHDLNRCFLGHDYPTDVISFRLDDQPVSNGQAKNRVVDAVSDEVLMDFFTASSCPMEGELIVSFETANREAAIHGWSPEAELLLYVVHGLLHLCGYDDLTDEARPEMRSRERELLAIWGFCPTGLEP